MSLGEERRRAQLRRNLFGLIKNLKSAFDVDDVKKARDKIREMNQRITDLETKAEQAKQKLQDYEQRIQALEASMG